jgi:hypothetical protein
MKNLSIIIFPILLAAACHPANSRTSGPPDDLYIRVTLQRSEHSMDSNSETTTLTVSGDMLLYEDTHSGAHSNEFKAVEKKYKLSKEDRDELVRRLNEKNLLETKSLSKPLETTGPRSHLSLSLTIKTKLHGKESSISVDGPTRSTAIKNDPLYQNSLPLIEALYRVVNRTDRFFSFQGFTDDVSKDG